MNDLVYSSKHSLAQYSLFKEQKPLLSHLDIELTERCNNECHHCYINLPINDLQAQKQELTTGQWEEIIRQAADLGVLSIRLTGGEPLLRHDFTQLYLFIRRLGIKVVLFTNARLITPEIADLLARIPPLGKIEISVYGLQHKTYDAVTGKEGAFTEFQRGISLLRDRNVPFLLKFIMLPTNQADHEDSKRIMTPGLEMISISRHLLSLDYRTRRDFLAKNKLIDRLRCSPEQILAWRTQPEDAFRKDMAQFFSRYNTPTGDQLFTCGAGEAGCVDAYGHYQMCMMLRHPGTVIDLKDGTLRQALTEFFPNLRKLRATSQDYLLRCAHCFLKGLCEQCPAKSWSEHGTLDTPVEYLCQVAHAQARYLGLLMEGENAWEIQDWKERIENFTKAEL